MSENSVLGIVEIENTHYNVGSVIYEELYCSSNKELIKEFNIYIIPKILNSYLSRNLSTNLIIIRLISAGGTVLSRFTFTNSILINMFDYDNN